MLKLFHQLARRHVAAIKRSTAGFKRAPWTSGLTVLAITLTLILPLLFWFLLGQLKPLAHVWHEGKEITLYLDADFNVSDKTDLMGRIEATKGVLIARFVSAKESLALLEQQEGMENIQRYLPENPLPATIEVMPKPTMDTPDKIEQLFNTLKKYPHVEQATLNRAWVSQLYALLGFLTHLTWLLGVLFSLMVIFIVRNLLRLAAHEHHDEIQVLKLIGATDAFILRPFLYSGALLGALGACGAFLGVHFILSGLSQALHAMIAPGFGVPLRIAFSIRDFLACIGLGLGLGWVGAYLPLRHQLQHIEPCH